MTIQPVIIILLLVRVRLVIRGELHNLRLPEKYIQDVSLHPSDFKWLDVPLHELKTSFDFLFIQIILRLLISKQEDQFLFHLLPLILKIYACKSIPLVFDLILNHLLNNILQGHDTNHFLRVVSIFVLDYLSHDTDVSCAFLEEPEQWLQLILVLNGDDIFHDYALQLFQSNQGLIRVDQNEISCHQDAYDVVSRLVVNGHPTVAF